MDIKSTASKPDHNPVDHLDTQSRSHEYVNLPGNAIRNSGDYFNDSWVENSERKSQRCRSSSPAMSSTSREIRDCFKESNDSRNAEESSSLLVYPRPLSTSHRAPSMVGLWSTTVPQSLVNNYVGGHVPSRNSLRHSRMISLSRMGKVPRKYLPPVIRRYKLGIVLATLQTFLGLVVLGISFFLLVISPNLRIRDIPYWSGAPLLLSGIFGLFLLCCCRKKYPGMRAECCVVSARVQYLVVGITLAIAACVACFCSVSFSSVHSMVISRSKCAPTQGYCLCYEGTPNNTRIFKYDLKCNYVDTVLFYTFITSSVANGLAACLCMWYMFLLWSGRYTYVYSEGKTTRVSF